LSEREVSEEVWTQEKAMAQRTPHTRLSKTGQMVARPVRIEKELNPIDATILKMKDAGRKTAEIAATIKEMGSHYNPRTISTRILKIRAQLAKLDLEQIESEAETWNDREVCLRMLNLS
jgi:transposase-like protein